MSQLTGIISRLQSLQETAAGNEPSQRFFEVEGEKRCSVKYFEKNEMFELEVYEKGGKPQTYQFDNIDIIAIEIFDLLQA
ncbi:YkuJ family protein [Metabacillus sp. KIGAM252]|uniref:YkuJ family protein n=1 Tax=Metabacillus flavus TaxID=2823519 RepID=A0ABS5LD46_9BACI|nr:YkuJ family protein [Metabacillus flavus]MBS2968657.1 YkuJ family protein [Metabacillus flavus]